MPRKRAQRRTKPSETKHGSEKPKEETKKSLKLRLNKDWWIAAALVGLFFLTLFLNTAFTYDAGLGVNANGETLAETYYLSGPDPYYNMRIVQNTTETGTYSYYTANDPLLNYPLGRSGSRPPLLNMFSITFSKVLTPFMDSTAALGTAMQFIPALFGALLVFPVYFLGKTLFGKKVGLIAALLIPIIPIHLGSGHGSAFTLFDHDSLNLLWFTTIFMFIVMSIKEKNPQKSTILAGFAGISLGALSMTWVMAHFMFSVIAAYAIVQIVMDIFTQKISVKIPRTTLIAMIVGYVLFLPISIAKTGLQPDLELFLIIGVLSFGILALFLKKREIPWLISIPSIFALGGISLGFLYLIKDTTNPVLSPLTRLSDIIYGTGIYGNKVSLTIAEASIFDFSKITMSFGPALFFLGWAGFIYLAYQYYKNKWPKTHLFIITVFIIDVWLITTAGRFLNDIVPLIAILSGWIIWLIIEKVDYKQMIKDIRAAGGRFHGLRKGIQLSHLFGIIFIVLLIAMPNSYLAFDAAIPSNNKQKYAEGGALGAFGIGLYKEQYWINALDWLNEQDTSINNSVDRPAFISWWDYGFYEVAAGDHPTVADNFQDGIPVAANFKTAQGEKEGVADWIIRLIHGNYVNHDNQFTENVTQTLQDHLGENDTENLTQWISNPTTAPSYNQPIGAQYDKNLSERWRVREETAMYHDGIELLANMSDENLTMLYHDVQKVTGRSIRYYGVEGYDLQIFNVFSFLADKSTILQGAGEDQFMKIYYNIETVDPQTGETISTGRKTPAEIQNMTRAERRSTRITGTDIEYKDAFYQTMFYKTYIGTPMQGQQQQQQRLPSYVLPTYGMKHFAAEFVSDYPSPYAQTGGQQSSPMPAVVIAKYYEGAKINGTLRCMDQPIQGMVFIEKPVNYYGRTLPVSHDQTVTDTNGTFNLIAPAGNITIRAVLGSYENQLAEFTFNDTNITEHLPITDDEAMRQPGTNYIRHVNITVNSSTITGHVYQDLNNNDTYEPENDTGLQDITVTITNQYNPTQVHTTTTNETGYYNFSNIFPSQYSIIATENGFEIHNQSRFIPPGTTQYNMSKPQLSNIEGTAYYDANGNNTIDTNETMNNAEVNLIYNKNNKLVDSITTNATGAYAFTDLIPGDYTLNATKRNTTTGRVEYQLTQEVTLEENTTTHQNLSFDLAPVQISGNTLYNGQPKENTTIRFAAADLENNTAETTTTISDNTGYYSVQLTPGYYTISASNTTIENNVNVTYTYAREEPPLHIEIGDAPQTMDIPLTRKEE